MNEHEQNFEEIRFESELRRMKPSPAPAEFMARLQAAKPDAKPVPAARRAPVPDGWTWWKILGWATPALAAVLSVFLLTQPRVAQSGYGKGGQGGGAGPMMADDVKVDHELVTSYDVVARLPDGQPVRFRVRRWNDQMVVTDKGRGLEIESSNPRLEVTPVRFETY